MAQDLDIQEMLRELAEANRAILADAPRDFWQIGNFVVNMFNYDLPLVPPEEGVNKTLLCLRLVTAAATNHVALHTLCTDEVFAALFDLDLPVVVVEQQQPMQEPVVPANGPNLLVPEEDDNEERREEIRQQNLEAQGAHNRLIQERDRIRVYNAQIAALPDGQRRRPPMDIDQELRDKIVSEILYVALKAMRNATNAEKTPLQHRGAISANSTNMLNGYKAWRSTTRDAMVVDAVGAVQLGFVDAQVIELKLAAERLSGRGFTGAGLIALVAANVTTQRSRDILSQLCRIYAFEARHIISIIRWLRDDRTRYLYAFYTGIPQEYGVNTYLHLAGVACRALNLPTMQAYAGQLRMVQFPDNVRQLIDELKEELIAVEIPEASDAWWAFFSAAANGLRTAMAPPLEEPLIRAQRRNP